MEYPHSNPTLSLEEKHHQENYGLMKTQCCVVSIYRTKIFGTLRGVRVIWSKNLINHSLSILVEKSSMDDVQFTCKVDLKPWPFWSKKGFKSFEVDGRRVDLFWNLRSAKFSGGPEPLARYYVALVVDEEVVLLLGDCKKKAYRKTKARPSLEEAALVCRRENVFGKKCFSARVKLSDGKKEHNVVVENSISGPADPEMWISIDGVVLLHVNNLQWKFRGNETLMVEHLPVQVFWDVHDWLFGGLGHALFLFKPGMPQEVAYEEREHDENVKHKGLSSTENTMSFPVHYGGVEVPEFCFFLYAWKME